MTHTVMSEESKQILRSAQCARIIAAISEMHNITLQEAAISTITPILPPSLRMALQTYIAEVINIWQRKFGMSIKSNNGVAPVMSPVLSVVVKTINRDLAAMQKMGILIREGNKSAGHWIVIEPHA